MFLIKNLNKAVFFLIFLCFLSKNILSMEDSSLLKFGDFPVNFERPEDNPLVKKPEAVKYVNWPGDFLLNVQRNLKLDKNLNPINFEFIPYKYKNGLKSQFVTPFIKVKTDNFEGYIHELELSFFCGLAVQGYCPYFNNSISAGIFSPGENEPKYFNCFSIFDGHFGSNVSRYLSENLFKIFANKFNGLTLSTDQEIANKIKESIVYANEYINKNFPDQGSSGITAILEGQKLYMANLGNSRAILCRKGQAIQISKDHVSGNYDEWLRLLWVKDKFNFLPEWSCQDFFYLKYIFADTLNFLVHFYETSGLLTIKDLNKIDYQSFYLKYTDFLNNPTRNKCVDLLKRINEIKLLNLFFGKNLEEIFNNVLKHSRIIRNSDGKSITVSRAFGYSDFQPALRQEPYIKTIDLSPEDNFILLGNASFFDGEMNQMLIDFVKQGLAQQRSLKQICEELINYKLQRGCPENISVMIIDLRNNK